jgi:hypothetical protein
MSRDVILHGGVNRITGDVEILEVHGGVANIMGRVGAVNQFGGVLNGNHQQPPVKPTVKTEYRDRVVYRNRVVYKDRIVYRDREVSEDILVEKITRLENQLESEREQHRQEVALLKERLQGALDAYHGVLHQSDSGQSARGQFLGRQLPTKPSPDSHGSNWDDYKPTKAECEAVYKNLKVWLECEQELEPINL